MDDGQLIKLREVRFSSLNPEANPASEVVLLLSGLQGVHHVEPLNPTAVHVRYHIAFVTLSTIEETLAGLGYHLDNSLITKLRRALYYYTEETQRANLGLPPLGSHSTQVFISRYERLRHGCRDDRPEHWRKYQ